MKETAVYIIPSVHSQAALMLNAVNACIADAKATSADSKAIITSNFLGYHTEGFDVMELLFTRRLLHENFDHVLFIKGSSDIALEKALKGYDELMALRYFAGPGYGPTIEYSQYEDAIRSSHMDLISGLPDIGVLGSMTACYGGCEILRTLMVRLEVPSFIDGRPTFQIFEGTNGQMLVTIATVDSKTPLHAYRIDGGKVRHIYGDVLVATRRSA